MYRDRRRHQLFARRTALLAGGQTLLFGLLAGRLYQLQVVDAGRYKTLSDENRISLRYLAPTRGRVFDRRGRVLAGNRDNYRAVFLAKRTGDLDRLFESLEGLVPLGAAERARILRDVRRGGGLLPVTVRERLDWREVSRIAVNAPDLPGLSINVVLSRHYPYGEDVSHVLGYVAAASEREARVDRRLRLPGAKTGKTGVERVRERDLRGEVGTRRVEIDARGRVVRELSRRKGRPGRDVRLALDGELQSLAMALLAAGRSGSAVVMDVLDGGVLALASSPGFDPNDFVAGISARSWSSLLNDPLAPLVNKAVARRYPPGSTFKLAAALAALEAGRIDPGARVWCRGHVDVGDWRFHCWKKHGHGRIDMGDALEQSCNVYFYELAKRTGVERIVEMARRLGFGAATGIGLPSEDEGILPSRAWKLALFGERWQVGETLNLGIGQGHLAATPLQLATMAARIANGRFAVAPRLETGDGGAESAFAPLGISERSLALVRDGMYRAGNGRRGTARRSRIAVEGMEMSGKTGTAQIRRITAAERKAGLAEEDLPWRERSHGLFVGFAPAHRPRYAAAVVVEHGGSGGRAAAPVARDLLLAAQRLGADEPDLPGAPRREAA